MKRILVGLISFFLLLAAAQPVQAAQGSVLGIHILHPGEVESVTQLFPNKDKISYVTIPVTLDDLEKHDEWQTFFDYAKKNNIVPIVRLATQPQGPVWKIPTKKDVADLLDFLNTLNWPTKDRYIIVFNEVNHAQEWGGNIEPAKYAEILHFASNWAKSNSSEYQILPAAMDLAAPNGSSTKEAFAYLNEMVAADPQILSYVDYWNSHSYPNPGFSASPERTEKNSLRGYTYELAYVKEKTGKDLKTFITETGWVETAATSKWLESYYTYAFQHIWSDSRIMAVTPFVLRGDPGPFANFSFLDKENKPTIQYLALQNAMKKAGLN